MGIYYSEDNTLSHAVFFLLQSAIATIDVNLSTTVKQKIYM